MYRTILLKVKYQSICGTHCSQRRRLISKHSKRIRLGGFAGADVGGDVAGEVAEEVVDLAGLDVGGEAGDEEGA